MPKAVQYSANSVVYFSGDVDSRVYLLHSGCIALSSIDIETGAKAVEQVKTGEFFGVKSALGNYPREENAMVLTDSLVYVFSTAEFEAFAHQNTRIILQMLKVFSRELRQIHHQLESLMDSKEETDNEEGLFTVVTAFYKSQHYRAAGQVAERYKCLYPNGKHLSLITPIIANASKMAGRDFGEANQNEGAEPQVYHFSNSPMQAADSLSVNFQIANDLLQQENWDEAYKQYHAIIESNQSKNIEAAYIGSMLCLYQQKEYVRCIQLGTGFVARYPKSIKVAEGLMYLGLCYQKMSRIDKALVCYDKALTMAGPLLVPKIKALQAECAGAVHA